MNKKFCLIVIMVALIYGCNDGQKDDKPDVVNDLNAIGLIPTTESVQEELINKSCISCHSGIAPASGVDLTDLSKLIEEELSEEHGEDHKVIVPGDAENSEFYKLIVNKEMPPLPAESVDPKLFPIIRQWIDNMRIPEKDGLEFVEQLIADNCIWCHREGNENNGFIALVDPSLLVKENINDPTTGSGRRIIEPGYANDSLFYTIMDQEYTPLDKLMPVGGNPVDKESLEKIYKWIDELQPLQSDIERCAKDEFLDGCACSMDMSSERCIDFCDQHPEVFECDGVE